MGDARPILVTHDAERAAELAGVYSDLGWRVHAGWRPPVIAGWSLVGQRLLCVGDVETPTDVEDASVMAARGAGLVAIARCDAALLAVLVDDLRKFGDVQVELPAVADGTEDSVLDPHDLTLDHLGDRRRRPPAALT